MARNRASFLDLIRMASKGSPAQMEQYKELLYSVLFQSDIGTLVPHVPALLAEGGTGADLSATGPGILQQASAGGTVVVTDTVPRAVTIAPATDTIPFIITHPTTASAGEQPSVRVLGGTAGATEQFRMIVSGWDAFNNPTDNIFLGRASGNTARLVTAVNNVGIGRGTLAAVTSGEYNIAIGLRTFAAVTSGAGNIAIGRDAGQTTTTGISNIFIGYNAGNRINGPENIAIGAQSMYGNIAGATPEDNVCIGIETGYNMNTGAARNLCFGPYAGNGITTGIDNICIGYDADTTSATAGAELNLGKTLYGDLTAKSLRIGAATPTARLHLPAGTATASTAPLKFTTGTALGTPEDGAIEYDTSHLWFTIGATRYQLDQQSSVPTTITVANEATDTTCFPLFVTAATGALGPKTNAKLCFNSSSGYLGIGGTPQLNLHVVPTSGSAFGVISRPTSADDASWNFDTAFSPSGTDPRYIMGLVGSQKYFSFSRWDGGSLFNDFVIGTTGSTVFRSNSVGMGSAFTTAGTSGISLHLYNASADSFIVVSRPSASYGAAINFDTAFGASVADPRFVMGIPSGEKHYAFSRWNGSSLVDDLIIGVAGNVTVNESGADADFRIEGDTATNLLVCDAGLDAVQIGTTTAGAIADFRATSIALKQDITLSDAKNIILDTTTGTKIGTATTQKLGFYNAAPVVQPTALTTALTTVTCSAPGTPDYAIADLTAGGYGFVAADEGQSVLKVIANLQTRVNELETKIQSLGLLA